MNNFKELIGQEVIVRPNRRSKKKIRGLLKYDEDTKTYYLKTFWKGTAQSRLVLLNPKELNIMSIKEYCKLNKIRINEITDRWNND